MPRGPVAIASAARTASMLIAMLLRGLEGLSYSETSAATAAHCRASLDSEGWITLSPLPGPRLRLVIDFSATPYRIGRDVLVEMRAEIGGFTGLLAKGPAWRQREDLCAANASRAGCAEWRLELSTMRAQRVRPAMVGALTNTPLDESSILITVECMADSARMDTSSQGVDKTMLAAVAQGWKLAYPLNMPYTSTWKYLDGDLINDDNANLVASAVPSQHDARQEALRLRPSSDSISEEDLWGKVQGNVLPLHHVPYFSNCEGFDGNMPWAQLLADPDRCSLVPPEETQPLSEGFADADSCDYVLRCAYEESTRPQEKPFWFDGKNGDVLFFFPRHGVPEATVRSEYIGEDGITDVQLAVEDSPIQVDVHGKEFIEGIQMRKNEGLQDLLVGQQFIGVKITRDMLYPRGVVGSLRMVPHNLELDLQYWQRTQHEKVFLKASVVLGDPVLHRGDDRADEVNISGMPIPCGCAPRLDNATAEPLQSPKFWVQCDHESHECPTRNNDSQTKGSPRNPNHHIPSALWPDWRAYTLRVRLRPLGTMAVFNAFAFPAPYYALAFLIIALALTLASALTWVVGVGLARLVRQGDAHAPLQLRFWARYLRDIFGTLSLLFIPLVLILLLVRFVMVDLNPWADIKAVATEDTPESETIRRWSYGRTGLALATVGMFGTTWAIHLWARSKRESNYLWSSTIILIFAGAFALEFSLSLTAAYNWPLFIFMLKLIQAVGEPVLVHMSADPTMGMQCIVLETIVLLVFLGADDFSEFVTLHMIDFSINICKRYLLEPLKWTRGNRCVRHFNKRFGVSEAAVTARQRAVAEKVEGALPDGAVEVLLIWIIEYGGMLLEPIAFVIMLIFKREFDISGLYDGIREMDLLYYLFFGLIVVPAESLCDVLLLNAAERLHGWRVVAYLQRLDRRYQERSTTWVLAVADERYSLLAPHEQEDKSAATAAAPPQSDKRSDDAQESEVDPGAWKTVEQLAFSSQMWFLMLLYGLGATVTILGYMLMSVQQSYNPLRDAMSIPIVLHMLLLLKAVRWLMVRAGKWAKIWQVAPRAPFAAARKRSVDGGGLELEA